MFLTLSLSFLRPQFSFLSEEILKPDKRYVLAEFPHGAFPIGAIVAGDQRWPSARGNWRLSNSFNIVDASQLSRWKTLCSCTSGTEIIRQANLV